MSKKYADFISVDKKQWIEVRCYDDRGDPYPPHNFRSEIYPNTVEYAGSECSRVDVAWKRSHRIAEELGMEQTEYGKEREAKHKAWAKSTFKIAW